ncbi:MAG: class I SAM-dependent methyltransferase [Solirubrobacterales bacterium]|nr:class I SAM-dependent methyltransferase [Solirubrobacterales bacterium]MBV9050251.1 class I SAM-dependent methyltransferase [Solirubrobacterales bacterium]
MSVIWHDLECGAYAEDLPLWRELASEHGDPILDLGAGTGRVALDLARHGHRVTALDHDAELLVELAVRAHGLEVETVLADARAFELGRRFSLCVVPMQTIQLLGGVVARARLLDCARRHLRSGGTLAIAIAETLELYEVVDPTFAPLPDICERDGIVYYSQPIAVRAQGERYTLERRRETVAADGRRSATNDIIELDRVTSAELEREAAAAGFTALGTRSVAPTRDYAGSEVVIVSA